jgi:imidazolonepropionase-like amidohydrolase
MGLKNVKLVYDGGVKLAFGTDSGANPMRVQGWQEHRELQLLVKAGLTPMQAIISATRTNSELLHVSARYGVIAPGKEAKLLLLSANPLDDIYNTTKIAGR